jgi:PhoH-like ATPase
MYVLDTNVLLHDPTAIHAFNEHKVIIPMTVLEELDTIKDRKQKDVSREARIAIRTIDTLLAEATPKQIQQGVELPELYNEQGNQQQRGSLAVFPDQLLIEEFSSTPHNSSPQQANDNRIIQVALSLQKQYPERHICLVTKDINMRIKAKGSGLENVEDYRRDRVLDDINLLSKGYESFEGSFWDHIETVDTRHQQGRTVHVIDKTVIPNAHLGMFVRDDGHFCAQILEIDDQSLYLEDLSQAHLLERQVWGLKPRNMEQAMALHLLNSPDIDLTIMTGPAGSGKTLLALATGIQNIIEEKRFDKLIVARSTPPIAEDIGFLPGTEEEKMAPWLAAFDDNLEVLHGKDESCGGSMEYVKERANIQFKSLNFMRGRSFNNAYIIIDEAQSLTQFQLKSIITRVGKNSKIVILGNLAQIDNPYINPLTSGLTYCVEKFKTFAHAGSMHVNGIERSRLAAFAEENL